VCPVKFYLKGLKENTERVPDAEEYYRNKKAGSHYYPAIVEAPLTRTMARDLVTSNLWMYWVSHTVACSYLFYKYNSP
jgi:hypothetical protein